MFAFKASRSAAIWARTSVSSERMLSAWARTSSRDWTISGDYVGRAANSLSTTAGRRPYAEPLLRRRETARMAIARFALVALDCPDPQALAEFYAAITGWEVTQPY